MNTSLQVNKVVMGGLLAALLVSCVSSPATRSVIGSGAFIHGVNREKTGTDFDAFYLESIDGAPVSTPTFRSSFVKPVPIGPGERLIVVHYEGMDGTLMRYPRIAQAAVEAKIKAGVTYVVDGRNEGDTVLIWISRADTGEKVTGEAVATKADLKPPPPIRLLKYAIPFGL